MKFKRFCPIVNTTKLAEIKAFYTTNFGFKPTFDAEMYLGLKSPAGLEIAFMTPSEGGQGYSGQSLTFSFEVDDVDAEYARVKALGLTIIAEPKDNPWGDRSFITVDPIGVFLYIYKPIMPDETFKQYVKE
ncbi:MAG: VOC family protein [Planctomycetota bacterium]